MRNQVLGFNGHESAPCLQILLKPSVHHRPKGAWQPESHIQRLLGSQAANIPGRGRRSSRNSLPQERALFGGFLLSLLASRMFHTCLFLLWGWSWPMPLRGRQYSFADGARAQGISPRAGSMSWRRTLGPPAGGSRQGLAVETMDSCRTGAPWTL